MRDGSEEDGGAVPLGDGVVAGCGVLGAAALVVAGANDRMGIALVGLALLTVLTAVASHTAVVGGRTTTARRTAGVVAAAIATGLFLAFASGTGAIAVAAISVVAGLGRTGSWPLRTIGLVSLAVVAVAAVTGA